MPIDDNVLLVDLGGICPLDNSNTKPPHNKYGLPKLTKNFAWNRAEMELQGKEKFKAENNLNSNS